MPNLLNQLIFNNNLKENYYKENFTYYLYFVKILKIRKYLILLKVNRFFFL